MIIIKEKNLKDSDVSTLNKYFRNLDKDKILWIISIFGILISLMLMIAYFAFGLFSLVIFIVILPPVLKVILKKIHIRIKYLLLILFIFLGVGFSYAINKYSGLSNPESQNAESIESALKESEDKANKAIAEKEALEKKIAEAEAINNDYPEEVDGIETSVKMAQEANVKIVDESKEKTYSVLQVVDGDTMKVSELGTLRLIGIDTPETVDPRKEIQCFGKEASEKAKELLDGRKVRLEFDSSQGRVDKYGRTLVYVFREDGLFFNLEMVKQGYAHEYMYSVPYKYQSEFKAAQKTAQEAKLGLWGDACQCEKGNEISSICSACNQLTVTKSNWDCSTYTEKVTSNTCSSKCTVSTPTPKPSACIYSCSSPDRNCPDFSTHSQAVTFFNCCGFSATNDPMQLDGTGVDDGDPCESLP